MKSFSTIGQEQFSELASLFTAFHEDERGDNENLGRLLILALILIPLIILIAFFGDNIATKAQEQWNKIFNQPVASPDRPANPE